MDKRLRHAFIGVKDFVVMWPEMEALATGDIDLLPYLVELVLEFDQRLNSQRDLIQFS